MNIEPRCYLHVVSCKNTTFKIVLLFLSYILALVLVCFGVHIVTSSQTEKELLLAPVTGITLYPVGHGMYESYINVSVYDNITCMIGIARLRNKESLYKYTINKYPINSTQNIVSPKLNSTVCYLYHAPYNWFGMGIAMIVFGGLWILFPILEMLVRLIYEVYTRCEIFICSLIVHYPRLSPSFYENIQDDNSPPKYIM